MGRHKHEKGVREVYEHDIARKKSVCSVCDFSVPGTHLGNLRNHLKRKHPEVLETVNAGERHQRGERPRKIVKCTVEYDEQELLDSWVDLVTVEGRPFLLLDSPALRKIAKPLFDALDLELLTSATVCEAIKQRAEITRDEIRKQLHGKIIHLKIDSATRNRRRVVGINAQVVIDGKVVIKTLSSEDMQTTHTAIHIKQHVLNVVERFHIDMQQVYSVTQDNGKNFVCAANMMTYDVNEIEDDDSIYEDEGEDDGEDDGEDGGEDDGEEDSLFDLNEFALVGVQVIRCAAHTLNLGVEDTFDESCIKSLLKKVRALAQHLRTTIVAEQLRALKLTQAKLDNITRWNSKYDMVLSVKRLREFCASQNITMLTAADWDDVDTFLEVFKPTKIASKRFQHAQLCTGDFFKYWLDLTLKVSEMCLSAPTKQFAEPLLKHLKSREHLIFGDNPNLNAALYLDPRFRRVFVKIRPEFFNVSEARNHLLKVYRQLKNVEKHINARNETESTVASNSTHLSQSISSDSTEDNASTMATAQNLNESANNDPLKTFMRLLYDEPDQEQLCTDEDDDMIAAEAIIRQYDDRVPIETNLLEYWYGKRYAHPILYQLAMVVHGVPATQVSVERCFSILRFIFSVYRTRIHPEILADIMLIRLNAKK